MGQFLGPQVHELQGRLLRAHVVEEAVVGRVAGFGGLSSDSDFFFFSPAPPGMEGGASGSSSSSSSSSCAGGACCCSGMKACHGFSRRRVAAEVGRPGHCARARRSAGWGSWGNRVCTGIGRPGSPGVGWDGSPPSRVAIGCCLPGGAQSKVERGGDGVQRAARARIPQCPRCLVIDIAFMRLARA